MLTDIEIAYIAGLLDADGWISLSDTGRSATSRVMTFRVGIVNANKPVLDWICLHFGGRVRPHSRPKSREGKNWRQIWSYVPLCDSIKPFLLAIRPHLRIKTRQCDIVLEFLDTRAKSGPANHRTPPLVVARRNELMLEVQLLNRVGMQPKLRYKDPMKPKDPRTSWNNRWKNRKLPPVYPLSDG